MNTFRSKVEIVINGADVTQDVGKYVTGFNYTDNLSDASDTAELELEDRARLWIADWFPSRGDTVTVKIVTQNPDAELDLKYFEIDEISVEYPPNAVKIKLNSVANNSNLRSVEKSKSWEKVNLSKIAGEIAQESKLELFYDTIEDPVIERAEQKEQSKLNFLQKLCSDAGLALKVNEKQIIIFDYEKYEAQEPVKVLKYGDMKRFSATATISKIYSACHVKYQHGKKAELIEHTYKDATKSSGMTLEINKKVETQAEAEKLAKKELRKKNQEEIKVSAEVIGAAEYMAGNVLELQEHGFFDGRYIIERASHRVGGGYSVSLELRKCLTGY